jgi:CHASE1-domain containing sensor protein
MGLDVLTRPARVAAERARDTGEPSATGRYRLIDEKGSSYGLVMYLPVYTGKVANIDQRRAALLGLVNVVLRVEDMLAQILNEPLLSGVQMRIHDLGPVGIPPPQAGLATLFYATRADTPLPQWWQWQDHHDRRLEVAGRQWALEFDDAPGVSPWLRRFPLLVLLAGLSITLLLYGILRDSARRPGHPGSAHAALVHAAAPRSHAQPGVLQGRLRALPRLQPRLRGIHRPAAREDHRQDRRRRGPR